MEDSALVLRAQKGSQSAYEDLIRRYARLIWASIYGLIDDAADTEDLVQETFIRAWQSLGTLREPVKFRGWLLMIARNEALQHVRSADRYDKVVEEAVSVNHFKDAEPEPVSSQEDVNKLHKALKELPERYRLPITLRYLEGYDYNQIAGALGLADGSLRGLLNRGMKMLRENVRTI